MNRKSENLVLFLGAGASMQFGIPGMRDFVNLLNNSVQSDDEISDSTKELWRDLLSIADQEGMEPDLEWVLSVLNHLSERNLQPIITLLCSPPDETKLQQLKTAANELRTVIKQHVRKRCRLPLDMTDHATKYYTAFLEELLNARGYHPKIFTTNYDNVIELSNEERNLSMPPERSRIFLVNGFPASSPYPTWDPRVFEQKIVGDSVTQYLFKLHGSVDWYTHPNNRGVALNIPVFGEDLELRDGTKIEALLIYPVEEKRLFGAPFIDLLHQLRSTLLDETGILVVIGYSFRDEIFQNLFKEALDRNKDLRIFVANTDIREISKAQTEFGEDRVIPITEAFGTGNFIPILLDKVWEESSKKIIYQAEHLPMNGPTEIVEDPEAGNDIAIELRTLERHHYGAIYGPYRPLPEHGKYKVTYRVRMMSRRNGFAERVARIDISPPDDVRKKYNGKAYPERFLKVSDFVSSDGYIDFPIDLDYEGEPAMEYRIQNTSIIPIRVDRITIEKS